MRGWFEKLFAKQTAVESQKKNPVLAAVVQESALVYDRLPLKNLINEARRSELARAIFLDVNSICNTVEPVAACREKLAATMHRIAPLQALMIPPAPEEDPSGLRSQPGLSGELRPHLVKLCSVNDELRSVTFGHADTDDAAQLFAVIERAYWETRWLLDTLNAARQALGDVAPTDWFGPFLHATAVEAEHAMRWALELPPAFDENIAREAATAYAVFSDIVLAGDADPVAEWRTYCAGSQVPMPQFDD